MARNAKGIFGALPMIPLLGAPVFHDAMSALSRNQSDNVGKMGSPFFLGGGAKASSDLTLRFIPKILLGGGAVLKDTVNLSLAAPQVSCNHYASLVIEVQGLHGWPRLRSAEQDGHAS